MHRQRHVVTTGNGHGDSIPKDLVEYVPQGLAASIGKIFEQEGQMNESAEKRILTEIATNHRENLAANATAHRDYQTAINGVKDSLAEQNGRLLLVEAAVQGFRDAEKTAGEDRRSNARIIKGAFAASLASIILCPLIGGVVGFYALRASPPVQQAVRQDAENSSKLDQLIDAINKDRMERKAEPPIPTSTPSRARRSPRPEPPQSPGARALPDGAHITTKELPFYSSSRLPDLPMMRRD